MKQSFEKNQVKYVKVRTRQVECLGMLENTTIFEIVCSFYSYVAFPYHMLIKSADFKLSNWRALFIHWPLDLVIFNKDKRNSSSKWKGFNTTKLFVGKKFNVIIFFLEMSSLWFKAYVVQVMGKEAISQSPCLPPSYIFLAIFSKLLEALDPWLFTMVILQENLSNICYQ